VPEERQFAHLLQVGAVAVATLVAECGMVYGCLNGLAWEVPLIAHLTVVAGLAAWCRWWPGLRADVRLPLLLAAGTAGLGPVGAAGTLVTMFLTRWYMREAIPFEEWYESLFPDTRQQAGYELAARIAGADLAKPGSLTPFAEILAFGSLHQKQVLIALINQQFRPAFGPILKRALTDGDNAVRVLAATAMNKLEDAMLERTIELSRATRKHPGDAAALGALARHYDACLYSGILDARREEEIRARALEAYRQLIGVEPGDLNSRLAVGRLLVRGQRYAEAAKWLEQAIATGLSTPQADLWYMESLYHLGSFPQLREFARRRQERLEAADDLPPAALEAVRLWGSEEPMLQVEGAS
jgi:tetratricopeptide (TPR) repeat protein